MEIRSKRKRRILAGALILTLCLTLFSPAQTKTIAETKYELENRIDDIEAQKAEIEKNLQALENDAEKQEEYQSKLSEQISLSQQKIDALQEKISVVNIEISESESSIASKQKEIDASIEKFKQRLRVLYISGNESMLSIIFSSNDFYDMIASVDMVKRVTEHDKKMVEDLTAQKKELEAQQKVLNSQKTELDASKSEFASEQQALSNDYTKSQEYLDELAAEKANYEANYQQLMAQRAEIEAQIEEIVRKAAEEAERRRQEAASSGNSYIGPVLIDYVGGNYIWPVPGYYAITSYYGWRELYGYQDFHTGIDMSGGGIYGAPIVAANDGVVTVSSTHSSYGYYIMVDHGGGSFTLYAHCSQLLVSEGQTVTQGQTIAYVGSTGNSTGPHLHFEIWENSARIDPMTIFG